MASAIDALIERAVLALWLAITWTFRMLLIQADDLHSN